MLARMVALLGVAALASGMAGATANTLFEERFDSPAIENPHQVAGAGATFDPAEEAVKFTSTKPGGDYLIFPLSDKDYRGKHVQLEAMVKGEGLSQSATPYFNSKLKVSFDTASGGDKNPETRRKTGTYDWWKPSRMFTIPEDATNIRVTIGLQDVTGSYWVKDLRILEVPIYDGQPYTPSAQPLQKTPKYRGVDTAHRTPWTEQDFADLKAWNVNLFRYQMYPYDTPIGTREEYLAWIDTEIRRLDAFVPLAAKHGIKTVIDLQVGPGMRNTEGGGNTMSWDIRTQDLLVEVWRKLATHFRGNPMIYAYDPLNEPHDEDYVYNADGGVEWQKLIERVIAAIREIDADTPILVEATAWSTPSGFETLKPINGEKLIYSPHFYAPHAYTHQGIFKGTPTGIVYPGAIGGVQWDRQQILKTLQPVIDFQKKYNVPIYIGEFSVVRWAPGGDQWLDDLISIFEENGWDWSYHSFREYDGWSLEHGPDKSDMAVKPTTARKEVVLKYFARN